MNDLHHPIVMDFYLNKIISPHRNVVIFISLVWLIAFPLYTAAQPQENRGTIKKEEDLKRKIEPYFYMAVEVDKTSAWMGEYIIATYKLYVALDIQGKVTKAPSYRGFASYDIQNNAESYAVEQIRGVPFKVYTIKKVQLFGLQPGLQRLEPVELEAVVRLQKWENIGGSSANYGYVQADTLVPYILKSRPVPIEVRPLPESQPENFSGAVGQYKITADISSNSLAPGETGYITLKIFGSGNWHDIMLPKINWPQGVEVFEPTWKEEIRKEAIPLYKEQTLRFPFTVKKKGAYTVPKLIFTFFNPAIDTYQTVETGSFEWTVTGEAVKRAFTQTDSGAIDFTKWFTRILLVLIPVAVVLLLMLLYQSKKKKQPVNSMYIGRKHDTEKDNLPQKQDMAVKSSAFLIGHKKTVETIRKDMAIWKQNNPALFSEDLSKNAAASYAKLYAKTQQMIYGPEPEKAETEQLEAGWRLFKNQHAG